jgi:serine/threonine protein kinase
VRNDVASCGDAQVGKGSTGLVYQGRTREGHKRVAIKKLDLSKQTDIPALENEISMISMSKTDTIVEYLGSYMWENQVRVWSLGFRVQDTFGALQWENQVRVWSLGFRVQDTFGALHVRESGQSLEFRV